MLPGYIAIDSVGSHVRRASRALFNFNETVLGSILQTGAYFSDYLDITLSAKFVTTANVHRREAETGSSQMVSHSFPRVIVDASCGISPTLIH